MKVKDKVEVVSYWEELKGEIGEVVELNGERVLVYFSELEEGKEISFGVRLHNGFVSGRVKKHLFIQKQHLKVVETENDIKNAIFNININCKDTPCMFAFENYYVKEDKMENILKVGDKVVCMDDGGTKFLTKGEVYTVDKLDMEYIYLLEIKSSFSFNSRLFKKVGSDKTEKIKIVRKLEDLDGLENGMGLYIDSNLDVRVKNKNMLVCYGNDLKGERKENYLEALKSMGFKFGYKPSKVVYEVVKEIKSLDSLTFKQGEFNYFVSWCKGKYHVEAMRETFIIGVNYTTKEQAQKYVDELNEIIGVGK